MPASKSAAVHWCVAATLLLAGCVGSDGGVTPTADKPYSVAGIAGPLTSRLALQPVGVRSLGLNLRFPPTRSKRETFYLSQFEGELYEEFKLPKTKPFCNSKIVLQTGVNSIATTSDKELWLPVQGSPNGIYAYAPGCGAQTAFFSVPQNAGPVGVVFDANQTAYGLMGYIKSSGNTASVEVYPKGADSPQAEYTDPRLKGAGYYTVDAIGIDAKGKVYVSCCGPDPFVIVFSGSGSQTHGKKIQFKGVSYASGSISFDKAGNMIMPNLKASSLAILAPPYKGKPTTYQLQGQSWQCGLNPKETELACGNEDANTGDIYSYPSMTYEYSVASSGYGSIQVGGAAFVPSH
jgi:hypothetical protein